jgi:O-antigen/teichoic acid export membrane protein
VSLQWNIAANMTAQLYTAVVAVVVLPAYLSIMGPEAFGLVGLYSLLQAWFVLFDLGTSQIASREMARFRGGAIGAIEFRRILRGLLLVSAGLATVLVVGSLVGAPFVAADWLGSHSLDPRHVTFALSIMIVAAAMRWQAGFLRGIIGGAEHQVLLSGIVIVFVTCRFLGVFLSLWLIGPTPEVFFTHQLAFTAIELVVLYLYMQRFLPAVSQPIGFSLKPLQPLITGSLAIFGAGLAWSFANWTDKILLSGILPLADFGYFSLATMAAAGLTTFTAPVALALSPNLTRQIAEGRKDDALTTYRRATQLIAALAGATAISLSAAAYPLMLAWSGDAATASRTAPILSIYAIGNMFTAFAGFPYYLMFALGRLRLNVIGGMLVLVSLVPLVFILGNQYGAVGAGIAWLGVNAAYLLLWTPVIHHAYAPGLHRHWLLEDILAIVVPAAAVGFGVAALLPQQTERFGALGETVLISVLTLVTAVLCSSFLRQRYLPVVLGMLRIR